MFKSIELKKMQKSLILLAIILTTFSCKNNKKVDGEPKEELNTTEGNKDIYKDDYIENTMVVIVEGVFTKDGTFQLL